MSILHTEHPTHCSVHCIAFVAQKMVFFNYVMVLRPRNYSKTADMLKELAVNIYTSGGAIRKLSNEGIMRPYRAFRDTSGATHQHVRFVNLQVDLSPEENVKLRKRLQDHPDVLRAQMMIAEKPDSIRRQRGFFQLDGFSRLEEETVWPPQATDGVYEQIEQNWKEFSRSRWSDFLRS